MRYLTLFLIAFFCFSSAMAVTTTAVTFLRVPPSPQANGMGEIYSANTSSPMASIMNPAFAGLQARTTQAAYEYYPQKMVWMEDYPDIKYNSEAAFIGLNLKQFSKYPVAIGITWHKSRFDLGEGDNYLAETHQYLGRTRSFEEVTGTTVSIAVDYYVRASFGVTYKSIDSRLSEWLEGPVDPQLGIPNAVTSIKAHDLGFIVQAPVIDLLIKTKKLSKFDGNLAPFIDPGLYYSKTNVGGFLTYGETGFPNPLPRMLSIGYNLNAGLTYQGKYRHFTLLSAQWAREVNDLLVSETDNDEWVYESGLHDIDLWKQLVRVKSGDGVITKRGYELNICDFIYDRRGYYEDIEGQVILHTQGWSINYTQPLKILAAFYPIENTIWGKLLTHIRFEKHVSRQNFANGLAYINNLEFKSYTIRLENIAFH